MLITDISSLVQADQVQFQSRVFKDNWGNPSENARLQVLDWVCLLSVYQFRKFNDARQDQLMQLVAWCTNAIFTNNAITWHFLFKHWYCPRFALFNETWASGVFRRPCIVLNSEVTASKKCSQTLMPEVGLQHESQPILKCGYIDPSSFAPMLRRSNQASNYALYSRAWRPYCFIQPFTCDSSIHQIKPRHAGSGI